MIDWEKSAAARLPAANVWLERGERLARTAAGMVGAAHRWLHRRVSSLERAQARRAALRELYRLDDRLLKDIGLRRDQVADLVDGMFRNPRSGASLRPRDAVRAAGAEDITEVNVSNDRHYRSAA